MQILVLHIFVQSQAQIWTMPRSCCIFVLLCCASIHTAVAPFSFFSSSSSSSRRPEPPMAPPPPPAPKLWTKRELLSHVVHSYILECKNLSILKNVEELRQDIVSRKMRGYPVLYGLAVFFNHEFFCTKHSLYDFDCFSMPRSPEFSLLLDQYSIPSDGLPEVHRALVCELMAEMDKPPNLTDPQLLDMIANKILLHERRERPPPQPFQFPPLPAGNFPPAPNNYSPNHFPHFMPPSPIHHIYHTVSINGNPRPHQAPAAASLLSKRRRGGGRRQQRPQPMDCHTAFQMSMQFQNFQIPDYCHGYK